MKRCPKCNRVETDEALAFCRVDGTPLASESSVPDREPLTANLTSEPTSEDAPTRSFSNTTRAGTASPTKPTTILNPESPAITTNQLTKPKRRTLVIAALILIGVAIGLGGYFYSRQHASVITSIAVMPFINESGNADFDYLSDGMTETLISSLSQLPNISVKARSSVFRYKGKETSLQTIGRELKVQSILNGSVVRRWDQLTLSLELIDAQTENVIWSEQYNRNQTDVVTLQSEIARDVSNKLQNRLSGATQTKVAKTYTSNPDAYQLYLRGRFHWNKRTPLDLQKAVDYLEQAVAIDQNYALAYAALAEAYTLLAAFSGRRLAT